jgi:HTH-type transcriptional regulator/antitoxin HipB
MKIETNLLTELAKALKAERKRQKLSREEAASVCDVSASFIRDAEANPENCSLGKMVKLITGLGLSLDLAGLSEPTEKVQPHKFSNRKPTKRPDFGVSEDQIIKQSRTR